MTSLKSIADPTRNPRAAANYYAFWNGVSAWGDIKRMYGEMVRYTGAAVLGGCWEDAARGAHGLAEGQSVLLESVAQATGIAVWQIATTPVRIFTTDIPELWAAGRERMQGQGRGWDVVLTANNLAGDVVLTAEIIKIGMSLRPQTNPRRIYSTRELMRRAEEPGPYHNFPESFNEAVFSGKRTVVSDNYVLYTQEGTINGVQGRYEIGVRPSPSGGVEVITHRFFRPAPRR